MPVAISRNTFYNAQHRSFKFAGTNHPGFEKHDLVETEESKARPHVELSKARGRTLNREEGQIR